MTNAILSLLLALQLFLFQPLPARNSKPSVNTSLQENRLMWGLIDPELSIWFALLPEGSAEDESPVLWDWSWRGFLASIFGDSFLREAPNHGSHA